MKHTNEFAAPATLTREPIKSRTSPKLSCDNFFFENGHFFVLIIFRNIPLFNAVGEFLGSGGLLRKIFEGCISNGVLHFV